MLHYRNGKPDNKVFNNKAHINTHIDKSDATRSNNKSDSVEITNKMQPCNRIYYSTVHWKLNMFRAVYRSSSGALTAFAASGLHTNVVAGRSHVWVGTSLGKLT